MSLCGVWDPMDAGDTAQPDQVGAATLSDEAVSADVDSAQNQTQPPGSGASSSDGRQSFNTQPILVLLFGFRLRRH